MTDNKYPLDDNFAYLDTLDMSKDYTDEEIRGIYDIVFNRHDPKHVEYIGNLTEKVMFGNIFVAKRRVSDEEARRKCRNPNKEETYLCFTGRISEEEFNKRIFIKSFRKHLKS